MKQRIECLDQYLQQTVKLATEHYRIYVENGTATAEFHEQDRFFSDVDATTGAVVLNPAEPEQQFYGRNEYQLSIHIAEYGGDVDSLLHLLLWWLHDQGQRIELPYVLERNDNRTIDLWLDMTIVEGSRNAEDGVRTC